MTVQTSTMETAAHAAPDADLAAQRLELSAILGLEQPVALEVLQAALHDQDYARNLLASRRNPPILATLLRYPPRRAVSSQAGSGFSSAELLRRAGLDLGRWARTGFSVVDAATLERRRTACASCPNLIRVTSQLAYKLTPGEALVCKKCGCKVESKTRLPSESCPDRDPQRDGMSRWGEPWPDEAAADS